MTRHDIPASDVISVEFDGHIATVWLDRPDAHNAFAPAFWEEFPAIIDALSADVETRVVVIAARGPSFTAGIDLKAFGPLFMGGGLGVEDGNQPTSEVGKRMALFGQVKRMQRTFTSLAECAKPVIAAVHSNCIGAGVDLITACDIRYASDDAVFSVRETKIAMVADVGTLQRLPSIVDPSSLAEMVYTGRDVAAAEALRMGLVGRVFPDAESLHAGAHALAAEIAANSPLAVQGAKAVLRAGEGRSVAENLDYIALWNTSFLASNDFIEATMAFLQKRPPEFTGE